MSEAMLESGAVVANETAAGVTELPVIVGGVGISEGVADAAVFEQPLNGEATPETAATLGQVACVTCVGCPFFQQCGKAQAEQVRAEMAADGDETTQLVELIERPVASYLSELLSDDDGLVMARTERVVSAPSDDVASSPRPAAIPHRTDPEMPKIIGGNAVERGEIMPVVDVIAGEEAQFTQPMDDQEYSAVIEELTTRQMAAVYEMSPTEIDVDGEVESAEATKQAISVNDGVIQEMSDTSVIEEGEIRDGDDRPATNKIVEAAAEDGDMVVTMQLVDDSTGQTMSDAVVSAATAEYTVPKQPTLTGVLEMESAPGELAVSGQYRTSVDMSPQEASEELIILPNNVASMAGRQTIVAEVKLPEMEDGSNSIADESPSPEERQQDAATVPQECAQGINAITVEHDNVTAQDDFTAATPVVFEQLVDMMEGEMVSVECDEMICRDDEAILLVSERDDGQPSMGYSEKFVSEVDMAADDGHDACGNLVDNQPEVEDQTTDNTGVFSAWATGLLGMVAVTLALTRQWAVARTGILKESKGV